MSVNFLVESYQFLSCVPVDTTLSPLISFSVFSVNVTVDLLLHSCHFLVKCIYFSVYVTFILFNCGIYLFKFIVFLWSFMLSLRHPYTLGYCSSPSTIS